MKRRHIIQFETKKQPLLSRAAFARRLIRNFTLSLLFIGVSLFAGMAGYHHFGNMPWIDSFENAAMILSGMGPFAPMPTAAGKLFAGCYALYSGLTVIISAGIVLGPVVHRLLHRFHLDEADK